MCINSSFKDKYKNRILRKRNIKDETIYIADVFCLLFLGWTNDNYFKTDIKDFEYFASWAENLDTHPFYTPEEEYSRLLQELEKSELKEEERTEIRDIAGCVVSLNVSLNYINKNDN